VRLPAVRPAAGRRTGCIRAADGARAGCQEGAAVQRIPHHRFPPVLVAAARWRVVPSDAGFLTPMLVGALLVGGVDVVRGLAVCLPRHGLAARRCRAVFEHVYRCSGRRRAGARPQKIATNRAACALQLCRVCRRRPMACVGTACVHACSWPWKCPYRAHFPQLRVPQSFCGAGK
jgi:hypothetical protein